MPNTDVTGNYCHQDGHYARSFPVLDEMVCYKCGKHGHQAKLYHDFWFVYLVNRLYSSNYLSSHQIGITILWYTLMPKPVW